MDSYQSPTTPPTLPTQTMAGISADQLRTDREHLKILAILHYVYGALSALAGCAGIIYVAIGFAMATSPAAFEGGGPNNPPPPPWLGTMFMVMGGCIMLLAWALGGLIIYAGRCLSANNHRVFCMVLSGIMCLSIPLGTLLGVFTLIVLSRPSVAAVFAQRKLDRAMGMV